MTNVEILQKRVTDLEDRLSHTQHLVQQLNDVIISLRGDLDTLDVVHRKRHAELKELISSQSGDDLPHEKPPHY